MRVYKSMTTTKKKPIVYQIYPMSFMDSNNDGLGDLKGIISKLKYIKSLGVDLIWLSPIFKTGFHDNGYDVINYYEIDKHFGTKQDLITLIKEAKKLDIGILLDMVFNHTSNDSVWFKE
jgi:trehalose-6-phosphate hydrolase